MQNLGEYTGKLFKCKTTLYAMQMNNVSDNLYNSSWDTRIAVPENSIITCLRMDSISESSQVVCMAALFEEKPIFFVIRLEHFEILS